MPDSGIDGDPGRRDCEAVSAFAVVRPAFTEQVLGVGVAESPKDRVTTEERPWGPALVPAEKVRFVTAVATEVEEPQRSVAGEVPSSFLSQATLIDVPVGDVESRISEDREVEHLLGDVDPTLVDEEASGDVDDALTAQARVPPLEKGAARLADGDESEVVRAGNEDAALVREAAVGFQGRQQMRGQDHSLVRRRRDPFQRRRDQHVRIEVERRPLALIQEIPEKQRFQRGRELEHRVHRRHRVELRERRVQRIEPNDVEWLGAGLDHLVEIVDHEHPHARPVMQRERPGQHACKRKIVTGDDRPSEHV
jgi:hypothetical protein